MSAQDPLVISAIEESPFNRCADVAAWLRDTKTMSFKFSHGDMVLFVDLGEKIFEVHYLFRFARGKDARDQTRIAFASMFDDFSAEKLVGSVPMEARHSRLFTRWLGCKSEGFEETPFGPCEKFVMTRQMWKAI